MKENLVHDTDMKNTLIKIFIPKSNQPVTPSIGLLRVNVIAQQVFYTKGSSFSLMFRTDVGRVYFRL